MCVCTFSFINLSLTSSHVLHLLESPNHAQQDSCTHELALGAHITLNVTAHGWVPAEQPLYTRAHHGGEAVGGSLAHGVTRVRDSTTPQCTVSSLAHGVTRARGVTITV